MKGQFPARRTAPANTNEFFDEKGRDRRAARDIALGEPWAFVEHRTLAEVIAAERQP